MQDPNRTDAISKPVDSLRRSCPGCSATTCGCTPASCSPCWPPGRSPGCSTGPRSASSCARSAPTRTPPGPPGISVTRTYIAGHGGRRGAGRPRRREHGARLHRQRADRRWWSRSIGFDGILVALLGRVKPWGVLLAALLFGALQAGGNRMQSYSGISLELVTVLQALIVIFIAAPGPGEGDLPAPGRPRRPAADEPRRRAGERMSTTAVADVAVAAVDEGFWTRARKVGAGLLGARAARRGAVRRARHRPSRPGSRSARTAAGAALAINGTVGAILFGLHRRRGRRGAAGRACRSAGSALLLGVGLVGFVLSLPVLAGLRRAGRAELHAAGQHRARAPSSWPCR